MKEPAAEIPLRLVKKMNIDVEKTNIDEINQLKSKLRNDFLDMSQNQHPPPVENIEADASKFVDKLLPDDLIIFIPSSGINSNELHDLKSNCIIYLELNKNLNLGFVIDKTFLNAVALIGGNK